MNNLVFLALTEAPVRTSAPSLVEQTPLYLIVLFLVAAAVLVAGLGWRWRGAAGSAGRRTSTIVMALAVVGLVAAGGAAWFGRFTALEGSQVVSLSALTQVETDSRVDPSLIDSGESGIPELVIENLEMTGYERRVTYADSMAGEPPLDIRTVTWVGAPAEGLTQEQAIDSALDELAEQVEALLQRETTIVRDRGAIVTRALDGTDETDDNPYQFEARLKAVDDGNVSVRAVFSVDGWGTGASSALELVPQAFSEQYALVDLIHDVAGMELSGWESSTLPFGVEGRWVQFEFNNEIREGSDSPGLGIVMCEELDDALDALDRRIEEFEATLVAAAEDSVVIRDHRGSQGSYTSNCGRDGTVDTRLPAIWITFYPDAFE